MSKHTVRVSNGKYTFVIGEFQTVDILRHGEEWHRQGDAFSALHSIMCELDAARVVIEAVRRLKDIGDAQPELLKALSKHSRLVSDNETGSEWTR